MTIWTGPKPASVAVKTQTQTQWTIHPDVVEPAEILRVSNLRPDPRRKTARLCDVTTADRTFEVGDHLLFLSREDTQDYIDILIEDWKDQPIRQ